MTTATAPRADGLTPEEAARQFIAFACCQGARQLVTAAAWADGMDLDLHGELWALIERLGELVPEVAEALNALIKPEGGTDVSALG